MSGESPAMIWRLVEDRAIITGPDGRLIDIAHHVEDISETELRETFDDYVEESEQEDASMSTFDFLLYLDAS